MCTLSLVSIILTNAFYNSPSLYKGTKRTPCLTKSYSVFVFAHHKFVIRFLFSAYSVACEPVGWMLWTGSPSGFAGSVIMKIRSRSLVYVTLKSTKIFGSVLSGEGGSASGGRCC